MHVTMGACCMDFAVIEIFLVLSKWQYMSTGFYSFHGQMGSISNFASIGSLAWKKLAEEKKLSWHDCSYSKSKIVQELMRVLGITKNRWGN